MSEVEFKQISTIDHPDFQKAIVIYKDSFSSSEKIPIATITQGLKSSEIELWAGYFKQELALMAIIHPLTTSGFILLGYLATVPHLRNIKIGSRFLEYIIDVVKQQSKSLILEVEHPDFGKNRDLKQRRISFYQRFGAKIFQDIIYPLPALHGSKTTEMILMIINYHQEKLPKSVVKQLIRELYINVYNCPLNDPIFHWIEDIKNDINLVDI